MRERIHALAHRTAAYFGRCCAERLFWGAWGVGSCGCVECVGVCCSEACGKGRAPRLSRDITVDVDKNRGASDNNMAFGFPGNLRARDRIPAN